MVGESTINVMMVMSLILMVALMAVKFNQALVV